MNINVFVSQFLMLERSILRCQHLVRVFLLYHPMAEGRRAREGESKSKRQTELSHSKSTHSVINPFMQ